jgi:hypothetical protein
MTENAGRVGRLRRPCQSATDPVSSSWRTRQDAGSSPSSRSRRGGRRVLRSNLASADRPRRDNSVSSVRRASSTAHGHGSTVESACIASTLRRTGVSPRGWPGSTSAGPSRCGSTRRGQSSTSDQGDISYPIYVVVPLERNQRQEALLGTPVGRTTMRRRSPGRPTPWPSPARAWRRRIAHRRSARSTGRRGWSRRGRRSSGAP